MRQPPSDQRTRSSVRHAPIPTRTSIILYPRAHESTGDQVQGRYLCSRYTPVASLRPDHLPWPLTPGEITSNAIMHLVRSDLLGTGCRIRHRCSVRSRDRQWIADHGEHKVWRWIGSPWSATKSSSLVERCKRISEAERDET